MRISLPNRGIVSLSTVSGASASDKNALRQVVHLDLSGNLIESFLSGFDGSDITGTSALGPLENLQFLNVARNRISRDLRGICVAPPLVSQLVEIDVSGNGLLSLQGLEGCLKLTKLNVSDNSLTTFAHIPRDGPPGLIVNAERNNITSLRELWRRCGARLSALNLAFNKLADFGEVETLARNCNALEELMVYGCVFLVNGNVRPRATGDSSSILVHEFVERTLCDFVKRVVVIDPRLQQAQRPDAADNRDRVAASNRDLSHQGAWPRRVDAAAGAAQEQHAANLSSVLGGNRGVGESPRHASPPPRKSRGRGDQAPSQVQSSSSRESSAEKRPPGARHGRSASQGAPPARFVAKETNHSSLDITQAPLPDGTLDELGALHAALRRLRDRERAHVAEIRHMKVTIAEAADQMRSLKAENEALAAETRALRMEVRKTQAEKLYQREQLREAMSRLEAANVRLEQQSRAYGRSFFSDVAGESEARESRHAADGDVAKLRQVVARQEAYIAELSDENGSLLQRITALLRDRASHVESASGSESAASSSSSSLLSSTPSRRAHDAVNPRYDAVKWADTKRD